MQLRFATIPPDPALVWPNGSIGVQRMKRARSMLLTGRPRQPNVRPPGTRRGTDRNHPGVTAVTPGWRTHPYAMMPMTLSESAAEPTSPRVPPLRRVDLAKTSSLTTDVSRAA